MTNERRLLGRISINPKICGGRPCIKGHRIMVEQILDFLASGVSLEELCGEQYFPSITLDDVLACIAFAARCVQNDEIHFSEELVTSKR